MVGPMEDGAVDTTVESWQYKMGRLSSSFSFFSFWFFLQDITNNQAVSDPAFYSLIILYALVIIGSVVGNVLVITAVLKSPKMRKVSESDKSPARYEIYSKFSLNNP